METTFSELIVDKKKKSIWRESIFTVTINTNLNDSITTLFFVLSLVKKEYQSGILFTSKSNFVK